MEFPMLFEGTASTLFLLERDDVRIINRQGEEALVPLTDLLAFLLHLTAHHAAALALTHRSERLKARLSALLTSHRHA